MIASSIESRVEKLEEHVTSVQDLPKRMGALSVQISQLGDDVAAQIVRLREETVAQISELREETGASFRQPKRHCAMRSSPEMSASSRTFASCTKMSSHAWR